LKLASSALLLLLLLSASLVAQAPDSVRARTNVARESMSSIAPDLDRLQAAASQTAEVLGKLHIEKWKTASEAKNAAQADADSVKRNLTAAMPGMIDAVRAAPDDVHAGFKLYRNLNALHDVLATVVDATRLYGPRADYDALAEQMRTFESVRRKLGEGLESLTADAKQNIDQLRAEIKVQEDQLATSQAETADLRKQLELAQAQLAKQTAPKKKSVTKKKSATASNPSQNPSTTNSISQPTTGAPPPKS